MGCVSPGSLAAGGTNGDGQSGNATADPPTRTLLRLWPTAQPEIWEGIPNELGMVGTLGVTFDGGGAELESDSGADVYVPFAAVIEEAVVLADQDGDVVVDIRKVAFESFPPSSSQ